MKHKLVSRGIPDLLPMTDRSAGVHISEIIYDLCIQLGVFEESDEGPDMTRMQLGQALEHAIIQRYREQDKKRYIQPGEQECDDLFGTPDLMDIIEWAIHEIKLTWMSSNRGLDDKKLWKYLVQLKAYCYMVKTLVGYLHVCFINGDYKYGTPGGQPTYIVWRFEFTKQELEENWKMLTTHGAKRRKKGKKK